MATPIAEWTEDDVLSLPAGESDTFERKGVRLLDLTVNGVREADVLNELAKQLSAFANAGGGRIIYGINDSGTVDNGGVARSLKGRHSTKGWLEDVIPNLTDYEIVGVNVYEIMPKAAGSTLAPDKSLFVIDVPASDRAPHQSKQDLKYYVRMGGKSQPAPHRMVEDIRNRARHPVLAVESVNFQATNYHATPGKPNGRLEVELDFRVHNIGTIRAQNSCIMLSSNIPLTVRQSALPLVGEYFLRHPDQSGTGLLEIKNPLYPNMTVRMTVLLSLSALIYVPPPTMPQPPGIAIGGCNPEDVTVRFTLYADNAPERTQEFTLPEIDVTQTLSQRITAEVQRSRGARGPQVGNSQWS